MCKSTKSKHPVAKSLSTKVMEAAFEKETWKSSYNPLSPDAPKLPSKGEIKASIPKECFERSALHSFYFIFRDLAMVAALSFCTSQVLSTEFPSSFFSFEALFWFLGWNFYAFWMGTILTGLWVIGHECGHGAFSSSQTLNDAVGYVLHQALFVPYFSWQYTHSKHHRRTNHLVDGESHVPNTIEECPDIELFEIIGEDAFAVWQLFIHLSIGWPLYLIGFASTGRLTYEGKDKKDLYMDHFRPTSKMFPPQKRSKILSSTIGLLFMIGILTNLSLKYGFLTVYLYYWAPYFWTNFWLVLYTWLQHTDPSVPQYGADEWTWVKGALSTIDRPYGIFDFFHHKIGSTHVAHHLFHEMPFYKADKATAAIKHFLGPLYNHDPTPFYKAAWRVAKTCHCVEDVTGIQYYKSFNEFGSESKKIN
jgi:omega-6 fatty acid desaturase (delta-12 desaturase)